MARTCYVFSDLSGFSIESGTRRSVRRPKRDQKALAPDAFTGQGVAVWLAKWQASTDARFKAAFEALRDLMTPAEPKRWPVGFVHPKEK